MVGIKLVGVPQPKPMHRFSPYFQGMFTPRGSRADFRGYLAVAMATLLRFFWSLNLWVFHSLNPCMDFHQIFGVCLPQQGLELIRFWGVSGNNCCHGNT